MVLCSSISLISDKIIFSASGIAASIVPFIGYENILRFFICTKVSGEKTQNSSFHNNLYLESAAQKISKREQFVSTDAGKVRFTKYELPFFRWFCIRLNDFSYIEKGTGVLLKNKGFTEDCCFGILFLIVVLK